ncbi:MAG: AAA family ATPase [Polyangiaceae bacterium]
MRSLVLELGAGVRSGKSSRVLEALGAIGIEGRATNRISKEIARLDGGTPSDPRALVATIRRAIASLVPTTSFPIGRGNRSVIALVGPSGVGKTTTAAKLAGKAIHEHDMSVTLVACDFVRVGASDQLARFASLMGASFERADSPAELRAVVDGAKTDVVFVDTAGHSSSAGDALREEMANMRPRGRERIVLLCAPASIRAVDADRVVRESEAVKPTALVLTKLDETDRPAGLVHASVAAKLPIAAVTFGPSVPNDVGAASSEAVALAVVPDDVGTKRRPR